MPGKPCPEAHTDALPGTPKTLDSTGRAGSYVLKRSTHGTSLGVQQLRLLAPNAAGPGSIPGEGSRFLHATTIKRKRSLKIPMPE